MLEEERESSLRDADAGEEMSPILRRYWRRRAEEYKEEQFYKLVYLPTHIQCNLKSTPIYEGCRAESRCAGYLNLIILRAI